MIKDWDFGFYGKGIDGYVHYSLAMDRIREEEKRRKAIIDDLDRAIEECRMKNVRQTISMISRIPVTRMILATSMISVFECTAVGRDAFIAPKRKT